MHIFCLEADDVGEFVGRCPFGQHFLGFGWLKDILLATKLQIFAFYVYAPLTPSKLASARGLCPRTWPE